MTSPVRSDSPDIPVINFSPSYKPLQLTDEQIRELFESLSGQHVAGGDAGEWDPLNGSEDPGPSSASVLQPHPLLIGDEPFSSSSQTMNVNEGAGASSSSAPQLYPLSLDDDLFSFPTQPMAINQGVGASSSSAPQLYPLSLDDDLFSFPSQPMAINQGAGASSSSAPQLYPLSLDDDLFSFPTQPMAISEGLGVSSSSSQQLPSASPSQKQSFIPLGTLFEDYKEALQSIGIDTSKPVYVAQKHSLQTNTKEVIELLLDTFKHELKTGRAHPYHYREHKWTIAPLSGQRRYFPNLMSVATMLQSSNDLLDQFIGLIVLYLSVNVEEISSNKRKRMRCESITNCLTALIRTAAAQNNGMLLMALLKFSEKLAQRYLEPIMAVGQKPRRKRKVTKIADGTPVKTVKFTINGEIAHRAQIPFVGLVDLTRSRKPSAPRAASPAESSEGLISSDEDNIPRPALFSASPPQLVSPPVVAAAPQPLPMPGSFGMAPQPAYMSMGPMGGAPQPFPMMGSFGMSPQSQPSIRYYPGTYPSYQQPVAQPFNWADQIYQQPAAQPFTWANQIYQQPQQPQQMPGTITVTSYMPVTQTFQLPYPGYPYSAPPR
jgi:hypothetical protein